MPAPRMTRRQIEEARALRASGSSWAAIAARFGLTATQVRHYLGVLKRSSAPRTAEKPSRPSPCPRELERRRKASLARLKALRRRVREFTGMSPHKYRTVLEAAQERARRTRRPLDVVRLEFGVPTPTQILAIQARLSLPTPQDAYAAIAHAPPALLPALLEDAA